MAIRPNDLRIRLALGFARGPVVIFDPTPIAQHPLRRAVRLDPLRGYRGQGIEHVTQRFTHTLSTVDGADTGQDIRRVGPLTPPSGEPRALATDVQQGLKHALFGCACH